MSNVNGIFTKDDVLNNVKWFSSGNPHKGGYGNEDITIAKHQDGYGIIFRNECEKKLGDKHGRVEFGFIRPGVIAFRSSPNGYKLTKKAKATTKYIALRNRKGENTFDELKDYIGSYSLEYDKNFGLCYINTDNRK